MSYSGCLPHPLHADIGSFSGEICRSYLHLTDSLALIPHATTTLELLADNSLVLGEMADLGRKSFAQIAVIE